MNKVTINGITIESESDSISIINNKVYVGDKTIEINGEYVISGNNRINITCDKNVTVNGGVVGDVKAGGNVSCEKIVGNVRCQDLNCNKIVGNVSR